MTEYTSKTTKDNYKIIFETDSRENFREIEEAIRKIIDRNNVHDNPELLEVTANA